MPPQEQRNQLAVEAGPARRQLRRGRRPPARGDGPPERPGQPRARRRRPRRPGPPRSPAAGRVRAHASDRQELRPAAAGPDRRRHLPAVGRPVRDPRSQAEPRLNAWLARILGDPRRIRFTAAVAGQTAPGLRFEELGLSLLSAVLASQAPGRDEPSELEERLRQAFLAARPPGSAAAAVTLLTDPPPGDPRFVGLGAFRALTRWAHTRHDAPPGCCRRPRPAAGRGRRPVRRDRPRPTRRHGDGGVHVGAGADRRGRHRRAAQHPTADRRAVGRGGPGGRRLGAARDDRRRPGNGRRPPRAGAVRRGDHVDHVHASRRRRRRHEPAESPLGQAFPVLPRFTVADLEPLRKSSAGRPRCAPRRPRPRRLAAPGLVREGVERFARVRGAAELVHSDVVPRDLAVLQVPHATGDRWLALPFDRVPAGQPPVVAHTSGTVDFGAPLSGLFVDAWTETIPGRRRPRASRSTMTPLAPELRRPSCSRSRPRSPTRHGASRPSSTPSPRPSSWPGSVRSRPLEWLGTMLPAVVLDPASLRRARRPAEAARHPRDRGGLSRGRLHPVRSVPRGAGSEHHSAVNTRSRLEGLPLSADSSRPCRPKWGRPALAAACRQWQFLEFAGEDAGRRSTCGSRASGRSSPIPGRDRSTPTPPGRPGTTRGGLKLEVAVEPNRSAPTTPGWPSRPGSSCSGPSTWAGSTTSSRRRIPTCPRRRAGPTAPAPSGRRSPGLAASTHGSWWPRSSRCGTPPAH